MRALHAKELVSGYFHVSEVGDDVGKLLGVVEVAPLSNVAGECSCLDDEVEHFIDELGIDQGITAICCKLLTFT